MKVHVLVPQRKRKPRCQLRWRHHWCLGVSVRISTCTVCLPYAALTHAHFILMYIQCCALRDWEVHFFTYCLRHTTCYLQTKHINMIPNHWRLIGISHDSHMMKMAITLTWFSESVMHSISTILGVKCEISGALSYSGTMLEPNKNQLRIYRLCRAEQNVDFGNLSGLRHTKWKLLEVKLPDFMVAIIYFQLTFSVIAHCRALFWNTHFSIRVMPRSSLPASCNTFDMTSYISRDIMLTFDLRILRSF